MGFISSIFSQFDLRELLYRLPAVLIALSFHEWGHAYAAYRCGDPTARNLGRMTLNPFKHLDPIGFICLIFLRFGWAKPVPVNPRNFGHYRRDDTLVSLAGVTVNFLLALVGVLGLYIFAWTKATNEAVFSMLYYFVFINLGLLVFNLIPIPPLDGSHVLENLLIRRVGPKPFEFLRRYGFVLLLILLATGALSSVLSTVVTWILSLLGGEQLLATIFTNMITGG